jgi:uncharacterized protein
MDRSLRKKLIAIAKKRIRNDMSHDFGHALRVLSSAEMLGRIYNADMDVLVPAALFHDLIVDDKNSKKTKYEHAESARKAAAILSKLPDYPKSKIKDVEHAIQICSYRGGIKPDTLEAGILQDADRIETGALGIMRTFGSCGSMKKPFYDLDDPFFERRKADSNVSGLDHLLSKVVNVHKAINTDAAKKIARRREKFVRSFAKELKLELENK